MTAAAARGGEVVVVTDGGIGDVAAIPTDLRQRGLRFLHVMQHADHYRGVEYARRKGHLVHIRCDVQVAIVAVMLARRLKLGARIVHQHDLFIAAEHVGITPETRPHVEQALAPGGQQPPDRDPLGLVFIVSALTFPEIGAVA